MQFLPLTSIMWNKISQTKAYIKSVLIYMNFKNRHKQLIAIEVKTMVPLGNIDIERSISIPFRCWKYHTS